MRSGGYTNYVFYDYDVVFNWTGLLICWFQLKTHGILMNTWLSSAVPHPIALSGIWSHRTYFWLAISFGPSTPIGSILSTTANHLFWVLSATSSAHCCISLYSPVPHAISTVFVSQLRWSCETTSVTTTSICFVAQSILFRRGSGWYCRWSCWCILFLTHRVGTLMIYKFSVCSPPEGYSTLS